MSTTIRVKELTAQGLSPKEIAKALGFSTPTITYHRKKLGLVETPKKYDWQKVQAFHDEGHSIRETVRHFGMSRHSLDKAKKRGDFASRFRPSSAEDVFQLRGKLHYGQKSTVKRVLDPICTECGLGKEWNGKPLTLQLDHIDGDSSNNEKSNLRLLCPNCHSQTPTFAGRNKRITGG